MIFYYLSWRIPSCCLAPGDVRSTSGGARAGWWTRPILAAAPHRWLRLTTDLGGARWGWINRFPAFCTSF